MWYGEVSWSDLSVYVDRILTETVIVNISSSANWKAGPSSILGSAPQGGFSHWANLRWGDGEEPRRRRMNVLYECDRINVGAI
jgi:hypothetical protein